MKCINSLILLTLSALSAAAAPETAPATQPSDPRVASCRIEIWGTADELFHGVYQQVFPWRDQLLAALAGPAKDILHVSPDALAQYVTISDAGNGQSDPRMLELGVVLDSAAQPEAQKFLDQVIAAIPNVIQQARADRVLGSLPQEMEDWNAKRQQASAELDAIKKELGAATNEMSSEDLRTELKKLVDQKDESSVEVAAMRAEQEQIAKEISHLEDLAQQAAAQDAAAAELQKIVAIKQEELDEVQNSYGKDNPIVATKSLPLREQLAEARVQLLERQAAVAQASGGDLLADLRKRMVSVDVDVAQSAARIEALDERVQKLAAAEPMVERAEDVRIEMSNAASNIASNTSQLDGAQEALRRMPPVHVRVVPQSELDKGG